MSYPQSPSSKSSSEQSSSSLDAKTQQQVKALSDTCARNNSQGALVGFSALLPYVRLFKGQWLMMLLGILLSIVTLVTGIGLLSLSGWFLSATAVAGLTLATAQAFNYFTPAGGVRFFSIVRTASRYGERLATHEATFRLLTDLRVWAWRKLLPLSAKNLQGVRRGDLLNRFVADIDTLDHLYLRLITPMAASLLLTLLLYLFLSWFDSQLALMLTSVLLIVWLVMPVTFYYLGKRPGRQLIETRRRYRVQLLEYLQGMSELQLFGAASRFRAQLTRGELALYASQRQMATITALSQALLVLVHGFAVMLMLYFASFGVSQFDAAAMPSPMYALMVFAALACIEMMMPIAGAFQHLSACVLAAQRVNQLTEQVPEVQFGAGQSLAENPNSNASGLARDSLTLNEIQFGYHDDTRVLNGLSLSIPAGAKVALLGQTGCGKSSLLALITREWLPQSGRICLGGRDITTLSERELRNAMTVISQRVTLFAASLRDNLSLAIAPDPMDAYVRLPDDRLIRVLKQVGLESLLAGDNPLDVWIGDGGRPLSGGEQRRIGVARALLRDAPLLLLDEPTEGLDRRTEREILQLILAFAKDKTLLMISHRLTAMAQMDCIHLMEHGKISASGNHQTLLATNRDYQGLYRRLA